MHILISRIRQYWLFLTILCLFGITLLSLWPLEQLPEVPGSDKTHHLIAYAALMFPAALRRQKHWPYYAAFFLLYSGAIELIQPWVNRYSEWLDLLANGLGLLSGIILASVANRFFQTIPGSLRRSS